jgi:hypothetical protein
LVFAIASPSKVGIGALSSKEREIDTRIRDGTFSGADSRMDLDRELAWIRGLLPGDRRRHLAVRLKVWARTRGDAAFLESPTQSRYFDWAGNAFLKDAEWQRVLGVGDMRANAWDESIVLRCFYEEAQGYLPKEAGSPEPLGGWEPAVRRVMEDLQDAPLRDPIMVRVRDQLVAAIDARRALALGPRTDDSLRRQAESAAAMNEGWQEAQRHVAELGLVRESPTT